MKNGEWKLWVVIRIPASFILITKQGSDRSKNVCDEMSTRQANNMATLLVISFVTLFFVLSSQAADDVVENNSMEDEFQQDEEVRIFMIVFNFALQMLQHYTLSNNYFEVKIN